MTALVCTEPGRLQYQPQQAAQLQPGYALVQVQRVGVCGTDLHAFDGTQPYFQYPRILGHELSGTILDIDADAPVTIGEAVTLIPYFNCGNCIACRSGKPNCCVNLKVFGVHIDGGMQPVIAVPADKLVKGKDLSLDLLAIVEPLAIGAHGISRAGIQPGEWVMVMGSGPIGIAAMLFAKKVSAKVIVLDTRADRLTFSKAHAGADIVINAKAPDVLEQVRAGTAGDMPTVVIDASGNQSAINNGLRFLAHGGRYVLIGLQKGDLIFNHPEFHKREATLMSSRNATHNDFESVIAELQDGSVNAAPMITHRVAFENVASDFATWPQPDFNGIKILIDGF